MTKEFTLQDIRNFFKAMKVMLDSLPPEQVGEVELAILAVIGQDIKLGSLEIDGDNITVTHVKGGRLDREGTR